MYSFDQFKKSGNLVHCITNYVTVHDVANSVLAVGSSPVMSDDIEDGPQITSIANALVLNIGTLNERTIPAMFACQNKAHECEVPIVLDPVGAGASALRTKTALDIAKNHVTCIRANVSEIKALDGAASDTRGVDASLDDFVSKSNLTEMISFAKNVSQKFNCVVAMTGEIDIVTFGEKVATIYNGSSMQGKITGAGCMLSALVASGLKKNEDPFEPAVIAVCAMGIAGERAEQKMKKLNAGNSSFSNFMIDELFLMNQEIFDKEVKVDWDV